MTVFGERLFFIMLMNYNGCLISEAGYLTVKLVSLDFLMKAEYGNPVKTLIHGILHLEEEL